MSISIFSWLSNSHEIYEHWSLMNNDDSTVLRLSNVFIISDDGYLITEEGDVHKPAQSLTKKKQTEKLQERIQKMKDKRKIKDKLGWVRKSIWLFNSLVYPNIWYRGTCFWTGMSV